ncbi:peptidase M48 [Methylobacterium tarhaniae]|uniref:Peptidase M48 n=1 Tax=Methylobacterium tarhaniae TaxID=1187852 RepID=A0A0J6SIW3_9HYPH|nr:M48 family metallopeptidase [Methylobacterium tarhaniae]KMO33353.1 peptidase M48 [Methylobacterium tarhaniae]
MLVPLALLLVGLWEQQRGAGDWAEVRAEHDRLVRIVADLEARTPRDGRPDFRLQFRYDGQLYGGPYAVVKAHEARDRMDTLATVMEWRRRLPPVAIAGGAVAAGLSLLVLIAGAALGWRGRRSRDALVRGFSLVRRILPAALAVQILATTAGFVAVVVFEAGILVRGGVSGEGMKLLAVAAVAVGGTVLAAAGALVGLRRALDAFEPDPLPILGRPISPAEAPGLWRLVEGLAARIGALKPEAVVVGLTDGFFVTAGPAELEPGGARLSGRILHVPLAQLALLRGDETAAIVAHELAHYAGGDTAYSQRFLPIYVGVGRSLDAVAARQSSALGPLGPALHLGLFVMERFHLAVRHWSRQREFAADAVGAGTVSAEAASRALLRSGAVAPRIAETLEAAAAAPHAAPADLVAAMLDRAAARGLDDPAIHLEAEQAHPTDTHPPTRERIAALGQTIDANLLTAAGVTPPPHALGQLAAYFADPAGLCRAATADFLDAVRARDAAFRAELEATAAGVGTGEQVLRANDRTRGLVLVMAGGLFAAVALGVAVFGIPGMLPREVGVILVAALALAVVMGGAGAFVLSRGEPVILVLRAEGLTVPGLDRPIAWDDIADLDMTATYTGIVTRILLPPAAPWPQRLPGHHAVKLDAKRRIVTLPLPLPHKLTPQGFADLIGTYRAAAQARRILADKAVRSEAEPA